MLITLQQQLLHTDTTNAHNYHSSNNGSLSNYFCNYNLHIYYFWNIIRRHI